MDEARAEAAYQQVLEGLRELGAQDPLGARRVILISAERYAGQRFVCEGFRATVSADASTIEFRGADGQLLKTVEVAAGEVRKAA